MQNKFKKNPFHFIYFQQLFNYIQINKNID